MYEKCEKTGKVTLITKANALRRTADDKQKETEALDRDSRAYSCNKAVKSQRTLPCCTYVDECRDKVFLSEQVYCNEIYFLVTGL